MNIPADAIVDGFDVRNLAGGITRATMIAWRKHPKFPGPVQTTGSGVELYDRRAILKWISRHTSIAPVSGRRHLLYPGESNGTEYRPPMPDLSKLPPAEFFRQA